MTTSKVKTEVRGIVMESPEGRFFNIRIVTEFRDDPSWKKWMPVDDFFTDGSGATAKFEPIGDGQLKLTELKPANVYITSKGFD